MTFCGINFLMLVAAALIIGLAFALLKWALAKLSFLADFAVPITWIFWTMVALYILFNVIAPLFECAGL